MKSITVGAALTALTLTSALMAVQAQTGKKGVDWPAFRGANAAGIAEGFATPTTWKADETSGAKNVHWKTPIPGLAHSSPIVWGNKLFVLTAVSGQEKPELKVGLYGSGDSANDSTEHQWKVYCLDKKTGKILWERVAHKGVPKIKRHTKATQANSTCATDGKHLLAFFGSEGLYCYDLNGKLLWKKDLGTFQSGPYNAPTLEWGTASSPIIHEDRVIVQCDALNTAFLTALDIKNGNEIWRTKREEVTTWSTPTLYRNGKQAQIIVNGWKHIGGYDAATGKELWKMAGGGDIPVPTPVVAHDLIFIANAHGRQAPIYAIRPNATGDISLKPDETTNTHIAWSEMRNGAYMQTPLIYGDYVYSCRDNGALNCYEAKTGKRVYQERLGTGRTGFSASPVAADGKLYFTSEEGDIYVLKAGPEFKVLATNPMGEVCMATPAISEGVLYFRTQGHLVAIAE
jgi:outer membrane protein assembly factor BamB